MAPLTNSFSTTFQAAQPITSWIDLLPKPGLTIYQNPYDSFTVGTDGSDKIYMNYGGEVYAGAGNDSIYGGSTYAPQTIDAGDGADVVFASWGNDTVYGGSGADWLDGGYGSDSIHGGDGSDKLFGGNGNDRLVGDAGNDTLWSGSSQSSIGLFDGITDLAWMGFAAGVRTLQGHGDYLMGGSGSDTFYLQGGNVLAWGAGTEQGEAITPIYGYDRFICSNSWGVDHYMIAAGVDGGHVDMRALGQLTGYEHLDSGGHIFEKFVFGNDIVVIANNPAAPVSYDYL